MDLSSLQKDPWPKGRATLDAIKVEHALSPRAARLLRDVTLLLAIVVLLFGLRPIATSIERSRTPPFSFDLVMERYSSVDMDDSREQVRRLLGPPDHQVNSTIHQQADLQRAEHSYRHSFPAWQTWTDPKDEGRWVAILFAWGKVHYKTKHGF